MNRNSGLRFPVLLLILLLPGLTLFFAPLVLSTDSLYGFLAYKGSMQTGSFNMIADVSPNNINLVQKEFVSWWSPGQWVVPGLIHYVTGIKLGLASIITTLLFAAAGMAGYYQVFRYYGFSPSIITLSLVAIFLSSNFNYSYIVYQGGEILSFGIFPWFLLYVLTRNRISLLSLLLLTLFILACFAAKTTLTIYCALVLLYKWAEPAFDGSVGTQRFKMPPAKYFLYGLPAVAAGIIIYYSFLTKGSIPTVVNRLGFSTADVLVPVSSPVIGILSIQNAMAWVMRPWAIKGMSPHLLNTLYLIPTLILIWLGAGLFRNRSIDAGYKRLVAVLYIGLCIFFIFAYVMNTNIDYSSRHMKLLAFLCIPAFLVVIKERLGRRLSNILFMLVALLNILYFVQLGRKMIDGRYTSVQFFYRNNDKLEETDALDEASYHKLIALSKKYEGAKQKVLFFVDTNPDVAIDITQYCITKKPGRAVEDLVYRGRGPAIIACVSKERLGRDPGLLDRVFPDCRPFLLVDESPWYQFFLSSDPGQ